MAGPLEEEYCPSLVSHRILAAQQSSARVSRCIDWTADRPVQRPGSFIATAWLLLLQSHAVAIFGLVSFC